MTITEISDTKLNAEMPSRLLPNFAVMGKMGAGKTEVARILFEEFGYRNNSFATELKHIAIKLWGPEAAFNRKLMQDLGRKMREIDPMVWVNVLVKQFRLNDQGDYRQYWRQLGMPIVVDDLRFPNEYHTLRKLGFVIVRVEAHRNQRVNRLKANGKLQDESELLDSSETALDGAVADYTITNTTDRLALRESVRQIVEREMRKRA